MAISNSRYVLNDGKLYIEQDLKCRSRQCPNYDKVVKKIRNPLEVTNETE